MSLILVILLFLTPTAYAQSTQAESQELAIIEQVVTAEIIANSAQILVNGQLKKAELVALSESEYLVIATVEKKSIIPKKTFYSFLLSDQEQHKYSTPFTTIKKINEVNGFKSRVERKNIVLSNRLAEQKAQRDRLNTENSALESELGDKIDLVNILQLKLELESLSNSLEFFSNTKTYLYEMLANRRNIKEPKDIASNSKILSEHLNDAAKVTAAAERLSRKKKETALTKFKQQIKAVEEMQQADLAAMAKQLLDLRNARKKLENLGSNETQNQF